TSEGIAFPVLPCPVLPCPVLSFSLLVLLSSWYFNFPLLAALSCLGGNAMNISKYTVKWLTGSALATMDGERYEGIIADVREQILRNKYTLAKESQPVVCFADGWQIVPNMQMRHALREKWGDETM